MNLLKPILSTTSSTFRSSLLKSSTFKSNSFNFNPLQFQLRQMSSTHVNPWAEPLTKPIGELGIYLAILPDFTEGSKRSVALSKNLIRKNILD